MFKRPLLMQSRQLNSEPKDVAVGKADGSESLTVLKA